ncbi:methylcobalamin:coenzyme M methyltransferase [Anaerohalosphaera lusitana]|uniref:Methylcobalamin:coenzyme M methyltransferase n=1 Tax=Anaerohalosphaera lusitana TaxID=1936003 RepID=A0A1U9NLD9_9BACT|nr:uroporphyrinogen decarboxylase family protein [Anaerohalosphaera lusitana]AQT68753.1 methylcobalamin:coenzyme M methyltransferase [Anaerohalosphaera lusitana]
MDMEKVYQERLKRYTTALKNEKPDMVPIRPLVAEFTAKYTGFTCQELSQDCNKAFEAACICAKDFDWDAVCPNMVYVWAGITQANGSKYYAMPGVEISADTAFQYREPSEDDAFMKPDEYDELIADPTGFLANVWLPRTSTDVAAPGQPTSFRNNMAFLRGGMAMLNYFSSFGPQCERLRKECGTVPAIAGMLKAPLDIIGDKLRGYIGLTMDLMERPEKVKKACEALIPHLAYNAIASAGSATNFPVGFWMHRGCTPFVTQEQFDNIYWPTLKPVIEAIWESGHQTMFYAEGNWDNHLEAFTELPDRSIVYHVDQGDIFKAHKVLGDKFCISGGIPNALLSYGTPDEVRQRCKEVIDGVAKDGGYIMDASAIMQNDTNVENIKAMTEFTREYGVY